MAYRIREVDGCEYAEDLTELHRQTLDAAPMPDFAVGYWWLAFANGTPVAFAGLDRSEKPPGAGYLVRCGVIPSARGAGLQKKLIRARLIKARKVGWAQALSDTTNAPASANSLISCGFKVFDPVKPWGFPSTIYWRRKLA